MFVQLKDLQTLAGVTENTSTGNPILDDETEYDEYEESATAQTVTELTPIERKVIVLPSNGNLQANATASDLEIKFRVQQAKFQLNLLRDLIADISFQFSHVIRGQIRKNIRTRSQKRVKSLHNQLTLQARIYTRCRNHMVALDCDESLLSQYRVLTREDLKSSTAILDPNQPGSTSLKLSWIWHSGKWLLMQEDLALSGPEFVTGAGSTTEGGSSTDAETGTGTGTGDTQTLANDALTLQECRLSFSLFFNILKFIFSQTGSLSSSEGPQNEMGRGENAIKL
jgi:hypothetical protein